MENLFDFINNGFHWIIIIPNGVAVADNIMNIERKYFPDPEENNITENYRFIIDPRATILVMAKDKITMEQMEEIFHSKLPKEKMVFAVITSQVEEKYAYDVLMDILGEIDAVAQARGIYKPPKSDGV